MTRTDLMNMLYRRQKTVRYATERVLFLMALARPIQYASGEFTEVDGDALAMLRKAVS
jgi:hypothetical protein